MQLMITAQLATIPSRIQIAHRTINSMLPQVDVMHVMLNGHNDEQARELMTQVDNNFKVFYHQMDNSMTDAAKHYGIENAEGYVFTIDDDIEYPPDYVDYMISKIERYNRMYVVTLHGRVFNPLPIHSFYRDRAEMYQCLSTVVGDHVILNNDKVGCGGDGVMAWHTSTFQMRFSYCELPNMSQLWVALACNAQDVPQMVVEHNEGWLTYLFPEELGDTTIWEAHNQRDSMQTNLINTRWISR